MEGYGIEVGHIVDLRHLAAEHLERPAIKQWGLKKLAYKIMWVQIQKPKMVILGNWGERVLSKKQIEYGTEVAHLVYLRHLAEEHMVRPEMSRWGLKNLAREVIGVQVDKPKSVTLSNWGKRVLSNKQIEYAAVDAFVSFEIGRMLYAGEF
ncbi:Werner syndrome ATP-dependent helicase [Carex littledalei]|uniref:Werner syndrome ATP-dependent helicase n=1 Tax=Carex littledalei TaxID=544730 RepID=A0A833RIE1_9POAL|nr:Werner syndrome ATP-dependent helicase [Carex littledalei]